jgi:TIR domain
LSRIFLSHSSKDKFEAFALKTWLTSEGWSDVFLDLDPENGIAAGQRWERALNAAADRCEAVVFLVSANWLASGWCLKEYALARGLNKKLGSSRNRVGEFQGLKAEESCACLNDFGFRRGRRFGIREG